MLVILLIISLVNAAHFNNFTSNYTELNTDYGTISSSLSSTEISSSLFLSSISSVPYTDEDYNITSTLPHSFSTLHNSLVSSISLKQNVTISSFSSVQNVTISSFSSVQNVTISSFSSVQNVLSPSFTVNTNGSFPSLVLNNTYSYPTLVPNNSFILSNNDTIESIISYYNKTTNNTVLSNGNLLNIINNFTVANNVTVTNLPTIINNLNATFQYRNATMPRLILPQLLMLAASSQCSYATIKSGDTALKVCPKTSLSDLKKFNPKINLDNLSIGQMICCTSGDLPNLKPNKNSDGSCHSYEVKSGDTCATIAASYSPLTVQNIEDYNKNNYDWNGCSKLQAKYKLCLSDGTVPRPTPNPLAECGPYAPGDLFNAKCPLNACCSKFGFCGLTSEFCEKDLCYSNCGYGNLHSDSRGDFEHIAYWLDSDGPMAYDPFLTDGKFTRVHYAFVNINHDYTIDDSRFASSAFLQITAKKVASFGGWDFSTNPSTYTIFREGVKPENRNKFTDSIANFCFKYNLDGIDIDWEYPGAPDIPGIPADSKDSPKNYLEFIKLLKTKLGGKTLSMAIPSSYWYLKNYPITDIQNYLDYFVFMTYDLYGVWDHDKDNEIKCHANKSTIIDSMKMLDKAGVQIGKTYAGISNYGRSYKASSGSCLKVNCPFSGPGNPRGMTNTPGVLSDSEIIDINNSGAKNDRWTDDLSDCIFMRYDGDSIVSWSRNRDDLSAYIHSHGFKGSVLWVVNYFKHDDYASNYDSDSDSDSDDDLDDDFDYYLVLEYAEEAAYLGDLDFNMKADLSLSGGGSVGVCSKDPADVDIDTETNPACIFIAMDAQLIQTGQEAINYLRTINRKQYKKDHETYNELIQKYLWQKFLTWIDYKYFGLKYPYLNDPDNGSGDQYYDCRRKDGQCKVANCQGNANEFDPQGTCETSNTADQRDIRDYYLKDGVKDDAAKSLSDMTGMTITADDFVIFKRTTQTIDDKYNVNFLNCEYVDFNLVFPNPLDTIDSEYLDNMQNILDRVSNDYLNDYEEAYYSLTPLAALSDAVDTIKTVKERAAEIKKEQKRDLILSILGYVFMGLSILAMPFGLAADIAVQTVELITTTITTVKLGGKISGDSLAFGLISIIQPFVKFPTKGLYDIFKLPDMEFDKIGQLSGKFNTNQKFDDIINKKIKPKYCK